MHPASWTAISALLFSASGLLLSISQDERSAQEFFSHDPHIQNDWFAGRRGEEVQRDCRGCHVHDEDPERAREPQAVCRACHYAGGFELVSLPGFEQGLGPLRDEVQSAGFAHDDHLALACRICHQAAPTALKFKELPIPAGFGHCATCHGPGSTLAELLRSPANRLLGSPGPSTGWEQAFYAGLNADPAMGPGGLGPFLHGEHMLALERAITLEGFASPREGSQPGSAATSSCATCHVGVAGASANALAASEWDDTSCAPCHLDADGPLDFERVLESRPSPTALTFAHADHLALASWKPERDLAGAGAYERIERESCLACHRHDEAQRTFALAEPLWDFATCVGCHDRAPWNAAGTEQEHAARGWWHGAWQRCTACHSFGAGDMHGERPSVTVERRRPSAFEIRTQAHPFITSVDGPRDEACAACHRAEIRELPSRVVRSAFRHATHVPRPTDDNRAEIVASCERCHASRVRSTDGSAEIGTTLDDRALDAGTDAELLGLTYDPEACVACHAGSPPVPVFETPSAGARTVVSFPHRMHLESEEPLDCASCHVALSSPSYLDGDVGVLERAETCAECHQHDAGALSAITGDATASDVQSCALCHGGGIPALDQTFEIQRARVGTVSASQLHPSDRACAECHVIDPDAPRFQEPEVEDHVRVAGREDPHAATSDTSQRGPPDSDCLDCHWNAKRLDMPDPAALSVRSVTGNQMKSAAGGPYPGHPSR